MIVDIITLIFLAIVSACLSYLIDYCLGRPSVDDSNDINPRAIFFFWTLYLSNRRLKGKAVRYNIVKSFETELRHEDITIREAAKRMVKQETVAKAKMLFTWEQALGMCIICTNFWVSVLLIALPVYLLHLISLQVLPDFFILLTTPILAHFIIRKI
jgi:hypothetical protein